MAAPYCQAPYADAGMGSTSCGHLGERCDYFMATVCVFKTALKTHLLKLALSDTCELSLGHVLDCINFMTLTHSFTYFIIITVYNFLETLLYTVFITTLFNGNYIIIGV